MPGAPPLTHRPLGQNTSSALPDSHPEVANPHWIDPPLPAATPVQHVDPRGLDYVKEVDINLICPVCRAAFVDPVTTSCDHVFCRECINEAYKTSQTCPIDRAQLRLSTDIKTAPRIIINQLNALEVRCPNAEDGCQKVLARALVEDHVGIYCDYTMVACPEEDCEKKIARKYVDRGCLHSLALCPDCSQSLEMMDMDKHRAKSCVERKKKCEECGIEMLRLEAKFHELECEEAMAHCKWAVFGCQHKSKRKDLVYHAPECAFKIMGPMAQTLQKEIGALREEVQALSVRDRAKERRIKFLESYRASMPPPMAAAGFSMDGSGLPGSSSSLTEAAPYDSQDHQLFSLLESQESRVDQLCAGLTELEAKQTVMLFNETIPIKEQIAELRSAQGVIGCHVRWLMNLRLQERRPGVATSGLNAGPKPGEPSSSGAGDGGGGLQPRRLSDSRENITKL
jgi:TNF receptor-associated factor 5